MTGPLQKTDLFALVGLALLLVWTPAYVALDNDSRPLVDGARHVLPPPREGDRVVLEVVVREAGGVPQVAGPVAVMERRAVAPGAAPFAAAFVEHWSFADMEWPLAFGVLDAYGRDVLVYFDGEGRAVWQEELGRDRRDGFFRGDGAWWPNADPRVIDYEPSATGAALQEGWSVLAGLGDGPAPPLPMTEVLEHRGERVFGGPGTVFHLWDRFFDLGDSPETHVDGHDPLLMPSWVLHNQVALHFEPFDYYHANTWRWYHPDMAGAVGMHLEYGARGEAPFLQIDLLPREVVAGAGPAHQFAAAPDWRHWGRDAPREGIAPRDLPVVRLGDLEDDPRPVVAGLTLGAVKGLAAATPGLDAAIAAGGRLVAFSALVGADRGPLGVANGTTSDWSVAFMDADDRLTMGALRIDHTTPAPRLVTGAVTCTDLTPHAPERCSGLDHEAYCADPEQHHCPGTTLAYLDLDRRVIAPWDLYGDLPGDAAARGSASFLPDPSLDHRMVRDNRSLPPRFLVRPLIDSPMGPTAVVQHGFARARVEDDGNATTMQWNLQDGHVDRRVAAATRTHGPEPLATTFDPTAARPIGVVPATFAVGGASLVALSLLVRVWGTLQGGLFAGLAALYARVQDEDVLDHRRRDEIMQVLRAEPGLTASEVADRLKLAWGVTAHHLDRLRKAGVVHTRRDGRRRHHFPRELVDPAAVLAGRNPHYDAFLATVRTSPGIALRDIARRVGRTRSALSRTGARLERLGLVVKRRDGMVMRFYPPEEAEDRP